MFDGDITTFTFKRKTSGREHLSLLSASSNPQLYSLGSATDHLR
jgi:hypothetical protein